MKIFLRKFWLVIIPVLILGFVWACGGDSNGEGNNVPASPSDLIATAVSYTQINLTWTDNSNDESGFEIERDSSLIFTTHPNTTSFSNIDLHIDTTYKYRVRAFNSFGKSDYTNETEITLSSWQGNSVSTGASHTCAITSFGGVKCWGANNRGQLGDGTNIDRSTPVDVPGLSAVSSISAGGDHTCAVLSSGGVKCWGANESGQLGDGTNIDRSIPSFVLGLPYHINYISSGWNHTCAGPIGSTIKCWGWNANGQLGDGTNIDRSTPVDVYGISSAVEAISAGGYHTCAILFQGAVKCWGANEFYQLGDGTTDEYKTTPVEVPGLSAVSSISAGGDHTCAVLSSGAVKCWGNQNNISLSGVASISAGGVQTCAYVSDADQVKCWRSTDYSPVDISELNGAKAKVISVGYYHTCAISDYGWFWCWGNNDHGQLGDGTTSIKLTPTNVVGTK